MKKKILLFCSAILLATTSYGAAAALTEEGETTTRRLTQEAINPSWKAQQTMALSLGMPYESRTFALNPHPFYQDHHSLNARVVRSFSPRLMPHDLQGVSFFSDTKEPLPFPQGPTVVFLSFSCNRHYVSTDQNWDFMYGEKRYKDTYTTSYTLAGSFRLQQDHKIVLTHRNLETREEFPITSLNDGEWKGVVDLGPHSRLSLSLQVPVDGWESSRVLSRIDTLIVPEAANFIEKQKELALQSLTDAAKKLGL
jgi:hypothetical protein